MSTRKSSGALRVRTLAQMLAASRGQPGLILEPWLRERDLHMTYAPTGVGKTMFTLSIAMAVAGGGELFGWKAPKARKVLVWDGEMDPADLIERAERLLSAVPGVDRDAALGNLSFCAYQDQADGVQFPDIAKLDGRERVLAETRRVKPAVVILDNYSTLATVEDENKASSFDGGMDLLRELKKLGCAVILVHHSRKDGGSYRGSSKMAAIFNHITALYRTEDSALHDGAGFKLVWEKYRRKRDGRVADLSARLTDDTGWTHAADETGKLVALKTAVMSGKYATVEALGDALGCSKGQASKLASKAITEGVMTADEYKGGLQKGKARRDGIASLGSDPEEDAGVDEGDY